MNGFYCLCRKVNENTCENYRRTRRHIEPIRQGKSCQTVHPSYHDAPCYDAPEAVGEEVGGHLRHREQTQCEHNAHYAQCAYYGDSDESHHEILDETDGQTLRPCEDGVEGYAEKRPVEQRERHRHHHRHDGKQHKVGGAYGEDAAEKERGQVGGKARREEAAQYADAHSERPEHCNGRVLAHITAPRHPLYAESREHRERHCRRDGIESHIDADAYAAERGVGDAAADEHQPPHHYVCADKGTHDACKKRSQKGVLEECVFKNVHRSLSLPPRPLSGRAVLFRAD